MNDNKLIAEYKTPIKTNLKYKFSTKFNTIIKGYTISERLKMTIGNIEYQQKKGLSDDEDLTLLEYEIEKLKEVLERVQELEKQNNF